MDTYCMTLRAWAKGIHTSAAAVELPIRGFDGPVRSTGQSLDPFLRTAVYFTRTP